MHDQYNLPVKVSRPLRAMIEIDGGELKIFPIADNDRDELLILDALRFACETD
jgi:hypothetical protein